MKHITHAITKVFGCASGLSPEEVKTAIATIDSTLTCYHATFDRPLTERDIETLSEWGGTFLETQERAPTLEEIDKMLRTHFIK